LRALRLTLLYFLPLAPYDEGEINSLCLGGFVVKAFVFKNHLNFDINKSL